jgi:hypothetical protein
MKARVAKTIARTKMREVDLKRRNLITTIRKDLLQTNQTNPLIQIETDLLHRNLTIPIRDMTKRIRRRIITISPHHTILRTENSLKMEKVLSTKAKIKLSSLDPIRKLKTVNL